MEVGLDLVILLSHTSHRLQPLDVSVIAPFKRGFKRYRDAWVLHNRGRGAGKQVLAMWVSGGLHKALTPENIKAGFRATGIWPLDPHAVDQHLGPATPFSKSRLAGTQESEAGTQEAGTQESGAGSRMPALHAGRIEFPEQSQLPGGGEAGWQSNSKEGPKSESESVTSGASSDGEDPAALAAVLRGEFPEPAPNVQQYFVGQSASASDAFDNDVPKSPPVVSTCAGSSDGSRDHRVRNTTLDALLELPDLPLAREKRCPKTQPLVDYSKSILLTSSQYLETMELKAQRKEEATREATRRKDLAAQKRVQCDAERRRKEEEKRRKARKPVQRRHSANVGQKRRYGSQVSAYRH